MFDKPAEQSPEYPIFLGIVQTERVASGKCKDLLLRQIEQFRVFACTAWTGNCPFGEAPADTAGLEIECLGRALSRTSPKLMCELGDRWRAYRISFSDLPA